MKGKRINFFMTALLLAAFTTASASNEAMMGSMPSPAPQQQATVRANGKVVDANGEAVIGASVVQKGNPSNGTTTDADGAFSLNVPRGSKLLVSFIGYASQEVNAGSGLSISMVEDAQVLNDVVVVGYGVQKKKLVTGATVQVKGEDIAKQNTVDVLGALQSQAPGVNITANNGFLNQGYKLSIRGLGSYNGSSPFIVVDGVPNASLDALNPTDIESIDVLKDAASAAIYGSRAANGVILVTTKHGKAGQSQISYDGYVGVQNLYKIPTILTAQEFMAMQDEGRVMDGLDPYAWDTFIPMKDLRLIESGEWKGTNWLKEIINQDAMVQNHAVAINGGTERGTYALGVSYTRQEATLGVPGQKPYMDRYNFRVNNDYVIKRLNDHDFIKVGETLNYRMYKQFGSFATDGIYWNAMHNMLVMSPLMHAYNYNGDYYVYADRIADGYNWDISNGADRNPVAYLDYLMNQNKTHSHTLQTSAYLEIQPIKDLRIKSQFGYLYNSSDYRSYRPVCQLSQNIDYKVDQVSQSLSNSYRWSWENTANYLFTVNDKHNFDVLLGQSVEKAGYGLSMSGSETNSNFTDFKHAYLSNVPFVNANVQSLSGGPNTPIRMASFFGRINYNYDERYMATVIVRADGSSKFDRGHRWHTYPSISAGWVMSNEAFMESTKSWLDFLKIRASYGVNGNDAVASFQYLSLITTNNGYGGYSFGDVIDAVQSGSYAYQVINPDLTWEKNEAFNIGFDARLFRSRLGIEFDFYNRTTKDLLVTAPILSSVGANAPSVNAGKVRNRGVELAIRWNDTFARDFWYGVNFNIAYNKNKVIKIGNADGVIHGEGSVLWEGCDEVIRTAEEGMPMGYFLGYKTAGIFQNQEQIDNYHGAKINGDKTMPGDVIYVDVSGPDGKPDGTIDAYDRTMIGDPHPDVTMGLSLNFGWKFIDFSVNTYGAFGQQIVKCYRDFSASPLQNFTTDIFKRWHGEGTSNKYPRLASTSSNNWNMVSDIYVENGDYLKIKNITLGFDFKKLFTKLPLEQLRLYATVQNLFTFTGYSGMDPEIGFGGEGAGSYAQGIDLGYYPTSRNVLFGVNVKF